MSHRRTKVNPSEEAIPIGPVEVRFLLTGNDCDDQGPRAESVEFTR